MEEVLISIKAYAERSGKSVQAVYKQINGKENAKVLEGHIITQKAGNKNIKFLDETAVKILDEASKQAPTIVVQNEDKELIDKLTAENKALKAKLSELQEKMIEELMNHNQKVTELTEKALLLEQEQKKENQEYKKENQEYKQQILAQNQKVIELTEKALLLEQKNQEQNQKVTELTDKILLLEQKNQEQQHKSFWSRFFG